MGDQDQYDSTNSNANNLFGNNNNNNSLIMGGGLSNSQLAPKMYERMDIQSRVGKDITNIITNQSHNLPLKKNISNNQEAKGFNNLQNVAPFGRNHSRTTSSILFANKEKRDAKKFEEFAQQQQQQQQQQQVYPQNEQMRSGVQIPIVNSNIAMNNVKVNKSGNFSQMTNNYHQMSRIAEQFSCEKENIFTTNQFQQPSSCSLVQNQCSNYTNSNFISNNNHSKQNNIFSSQTSSLPLSSYNQPLSSYNQPIPNVVPLVAPFQPIQIEDVPSGSYTASEGDSSTAPQAHLEYNLEIINHMRLTENNFSAKGGYMGVVQKEINERMRGILLDWLVDVHFKFKLRAETLFISINLIDRYLEKVHLQSSRLQLLGITSLFIAAKYEEVYSVPHIKDLVYVCDNAYMKEEIFDMEGSILQVLNFSILSVSSFRFLDYFIQYDELGEKNYYLARYLIEIALLEYKMISNSPSLVASAAIYLVNKIRKRPVAWKECMSEITGYQEQDIRPCAKQICHIVQTIEQRKYLNSLRKKFQKPQFLEVAKIKIEQRRDNAPETSTNNTASSMPNNQLNVCSNISSSQHVNPSCTPFQQFASKEQETTHTEQINQQQQQYNSNNFQQNVMTNFSQNQGIAHSQNMNIPDQQLQQVESIEISVPLQAATILIEKRIATLKEKPSNIVQAILTNRLYSEGAQQIDIKVPIKLVEFIIEKKITNVPHKQLWQLPVRLAKIVTNSMFNPEKIEDLGFIPVEFINFMIETLVNDQICIQQNSQRQYSSTNNSNNNMSCQNTGNQMYQNFFNQ